jgi:hypothetical protein
MRRGQYCLTTGALVLGGEGQPIAAEGALGGTAGGDVASRNESGGAATVVVGIGSIVVQLVAGV